MSNLEVISPQSSVRFFMPTRYKPPKSDTWTGPSLQPPRMARIRRMLADFVSHLKARLPEVGEVCSQSVRKKR